MMAWTVMYDVMQWVDANGDPASGYVLKAYLPGTTTPTSIAIDKDGSSPQATITFNAEGKPEVSGNEIVPFIDREYKWAIFRNASDASANSSPFAGFYDNIPQYVRADDAAAVYPTFNELTTTTMKNHTNRDYIVGDAIQTAAFSTGNGGGGIYDAITTGVTAGVDLPDGGEIIQSVSNPLISFKLRRSIINDVATFGIIPDGSDNTARYTAMIAALDDGENIFFSGNGVYIGNFVSESKSFNIDLGAATLTNYSTTEDILRIGAKTATEYAVTESTLNNGDYQFTVTGASGYFAAGDIGYLWDSATRSDGQPVNYESVKIKSVSSDTVTITGFIASYKGAGAIKFYHTSTQLKNAKIKGGKIIPTNTHTGYGVVVYNTETVRLNNIETSNTTGPAVAARYCYDVSAKDIAPDTPYDVGSGNGYGMTLWATSRFEVDNVVGNGCRHAFDGDSIYFGKLSNISDSNDKSACAMLAHNGFAGYIDCDTVTTSSIQYPVYLSSGGYAGVTPAARGNHPFRSINVWNVTNTVDVSVSPNSSNIVGVYFQNSVIDCIVNGVKVRHQNTDAFTGASNSSIVRVDGIIDGASEFRNFSVDKINYILFSNGDRGTLATNANKFKLTNVNADEVRKVALLQGAHSLVVDTVDIKTTVVDDSLILMQDTGGDNPVYFSYSDITYPTSADKEIVDTDGFVLTGYMPLTSRSSGSNVSVAGGATLTKADIANRTGYCKLLSTVGAGTDNVTLPLPDVNGQELFLIHAGGARYDISVGVSTTLYTAFTMTTALPYARLFAYSGKWQLAGQWA